MNGIMKPDFNNSVICWIIKVFLVKHTLLLCSLLQITKRHPFVF